MADHLSMEFCPGSKCKQEYNNRLKREKEKSHQQVSLVNHLEENSRQEKLAANIKVFDNLDIPADGRVYEFQNLVAAGADFTAFSEKIRNNVSLESYSYCYGPYLISYLHSNQLLILKTKENEKHN